MKNLNLIINIVLAIGLVILFVLYFSLRGEIKNYDSKSTASGNKSVVFVNIDTLNKKYDMYHDIQVKFDQKQKKMEDELNAKKRDYEKRALDYQDRVKKGLLLRSEMEKLEQQFMGEQQNLNRTYSEMQAQLSEEAQSENRRLMNSITDFLKEYNKDGSHQYILSHGTGGNILFADNSLDITNDVLKGLNEKYNKEVSKNK